MKTDYKSPAIHRTPLYRVRASYSGMKKRCLNADGKNPAYANVELRMTKEEFIKWALPKYEEFLQKFPYLRPCTARFGDKGHYEIGNIKVISTLENQQEQSHDAPAKRIHGTLSSYRYCRCVDCKAAWVEHSRKYRQRVLRSKPRTPPKHGTRNMYVYHKCRCADCTKANRDYCNKLRTGQA